MHTTLTKIRCFLSSFNLVNINKQFITIIIQTTSSCNLSCSYCYCQNTRKEPSIISLDTIKICLSKINHFFNPSDEICILFHGGEPLLLSIEFYKEVFGFLKKEYKRKYYTGVQTNLTLLDEKYIALFSENGCSISTSLDGSKLFHDRFRSFSNGAGSYEIVANKLRMLEANNINYGVVSVINEFNVQYPTEFYSFLKEHQNVEFGLSPMFNVGNGRIYAVDSKSLGNFLTKLYDCWIEDKNPIKINLFENIINNFIGNNLSPVCTFHNDCSQVFFALDYLGSVYTCCHFIGREEYCYGNLLVSTFPSIFNSKVRSIISNRFRLNMTKQICEICEYYNICFSGCMANTINGINDKDYFCDAYTTIFRHIKNSLIKSLKGHGNTHP